MTRWSSSAGAGPAASQLLIRFLLRHLNTFKDVMLRVEKSGELAALAGELNQAIRQLKL